MMDRSLWAGVDDFQSKVTNRLKKDWEAVKNAKLTPEAQAKQDELIRNPLKGALNTFMDLPEQAAQREEQAGEALHNVTGGRVPKFAGALLLGMLDPLTPPGGKAPISAAKNTLRLNKWVSRGPGSPLRAHRATSQTGARSLISGVPQTITKNFPELTEQATKWAKDAYTYARAQALKGNTQQPLKGFRRFVTPDGKIYRPKPSQRFGKGYTLKFIDKDLVKEYGAVRNLKEAPWTKQPVIDKLQSILESKGKGDQLENLLTRMVKDYDAKLKSLPKGTTKGHFISLKEGGLDVAENFGAQAGRSKYKIVDGKRVAVPGNYAEQASSTVRGNVNVPKTWEEYVDLKLPELKQKGLRLRKKTKPTQFPDKIQRHIDRSQEIGITEPSWKDGSIDYIWRPQSNTGQIDIPPQSMKTFKGLRDEFFGQIEDLPSGSVWELNPKFKDAKRRRIYAKLFENDKRITRNADETLGWILRVP